mgnify:FL=1
MEKKWYESKGVLGGLLVIAGGVLTALGQFLSGQLDFSSLFSQVVPLIGIGLGIIGIRVAK